MKHTYTQSIDDCVKQELTYHLFGEGHPQLFITAGIHGVEATGIYTANLLTNFLDQNPLLKGSVKILPIANPSAFRRLERRSPFDELDLNRIFPGHPKASISSQIAHHIWQEAETADYIVDLHCCGVGGSSYTLALWQEYEVAKELAQMLSIPRVVQSAGAPGQLFTEATTTKNIPAVIIELPGGQPSGVIDQQAAEECFQALLNLLRQLEMLPGKAIKPSPTFLGKLQPVLSEVDGPFIPALKPGQEIKTGDILGHVNDTIFYAPVNGEVIMIRPASYIFKGTPVATVAPVEDV